MSTVNQPRIGEPRVDMASLDPVRHCVYTTIALIAWVITPPAAVVWLSSLGLWGYARAWRAGARRSRCVLRDIRLVFAYMGSAFVLGAAFTVRSLVGT
jgi:hypothetical protein